MSQTNSDCLFDIRWSIWLHSNSENRDIHRFSSGDPYAEYCKLDGGCSKVDDDGVGTEFGGTHTYNWASIGGNRNTKVGKLSWYSVTPMALCAVAGIHVCVICMTVYR